MIIDYLFVYHEKIFFLYAILRKIYKAKMLCKQNRGIEIN